LEIDSSTGDLVFSKVYQVDIPKDSIHKKTVEWIAITFNDAKSVIKLDSESKVIAKGYFEIHYQIGQYPSENDVSFTMDVAFKDNRYKVDIFDVVLESIQGIKMDASTYFKVTSIEDYREELKKMEEQSTDNTIKKYYTRLLSNHSRLEREYPRIQKTYGIIKKEIESGILDMAESLYSYVNKEADNDW